MKHEGYDKYYNHRLQPGHERLAAPPGQAETTPSALTDDSYLAAHERSGSRLQRAIEQRYLDRWLLLRGEVQIAAVLDGEPVAPVLDESAAGEPV